MMMETIFIFHKPKWIMDIPVNMYHYLESLLHKRNTQIILQSIWIHSYYSGNNNNDLQADVWSKKIDLTQEGKEKKEKKQSRQASLLTRR